MGFLLASTIAIGGWAAFAVTLSQARETEVALLAREASALDAVRRADEARVRAKAESDLAQERAEEARRKTEADAAETVRRADDARAKAEVAASQAADRADTARARAEAESHAASTIEDILVGLFLSKDPTRSGSEPLSSRDVLDVAAEELSEETDLAPARRARLSEAIGISYQGLGAFDEARPLLESASSSGGRSSARTRRKPSP